MDTTVRSRKLRLNRKIQPYDEEAVANAIASFHDDRHMRKVLQPLMVCDKIIKETL